MLEFLKNKLYADLNSKIGRWLRGDYLLFEMLAITIILLSENTQILYSVDSHRVKL